MSLRTTRQDTEVLTNADGMARATRQEAEVLAAGDGVMRATRQEAEVLTEGDGLARITRQVVEVLLRPPWVIVQSLGLTQSVTFTGPTPTSGKHNLNLQQTVETRVVPGPQVVEQFIPFTQGVGRVLEVDVNQSLDLTDSGERATKPVDSLALTETVSAGKGGDVEDDLGIEQTVVHTAVLNRTATNTLGISQSVAYSLLLLDTLHQYTPFVGTTTDPNAPTPPSLSLDGPNPDVLAPFQLLYPPTGTVTDSVSIRAPNLGNRDRLTFDRIQRETRGGTLIIYADPQWPKIQTLVLTFSVLKRTEALELLRFMKDHLGVKIGLIDWEQRYWEGVIVTPEEPIVADHHDSYSASFSFEGELSDNNPQIVPGTSCAGTAKMAKVKAARASCVCTPESGGSSGSDSMYSAESDATVVLGTPLYLTVAGHVNLAQANAAGTTQVAGFANEAGTPTVSVDYISEGKITKSDWSDVAGTASLTVGSVYFLSPTTAGRITTTAPATVGQYVVKVGRATSATILDLEIEAPIRL